MTERKSLIRAMYELCLKFKELEQAALREVGGDAELVEMDKAITELCRSVGLKRDLLEQDCY